MTSGGRRREYELVRRLSQEHDLHFVALTETFDEDLENSASMEKICSSVTVLRVTGNDDRSRPSEVRRHACPGALEIVETRTSN
jgi:hypothetical protein